MSDPAIPPAKKTAKTPAPQTPLPIDELDDVKQQAPATITKVFEDLRASLNAEADFSARARRNASISSYLNKIASEDLIISKYNVLIIYDEKKLIRSDADKIYSAITNFESKKPILLILYTPGGEIPPAYFIGKLCREFSDKKFVVAVPRRAKSAGTLICCAADEIHMGSMSELGPIDPQIGSLPALGLKNSVEHIAELVKNHPESSSMFAKYLSESLTLEHLGYYERVAESAVQYAVRLLDPHRQNLSQSPEKIATDLVYNYKDHGFVIDRSEAADIFSSKTIKSNSPEYDFANRIYDLLETIRWMSNARGYYFYFVGSMDSEGRFLENQD